MASTVPTILPNKVSPLHLAALTAPDSLAIKSGERELSYQQLSEHVLALGQQLTEKGLTTGDKLGVICSNRPEALMLYWACIDLGLLFCPISPKFPQTQILALLQQYDIRHLWSDDCKFLNNTESKHSLLPEPLTDLNFSAKSELTRAETIPQIDPDTRANIIFTSGSSGTPKAAVHCLSQHIVSAKGSASLISLNSGDRWLASLPLFHIGGLAIFNRCALATACVVFATEGQSLPQQLITNKVTHVSLVSTQLQRLLQQHSDSLQYCKTLLLGGGAIPQPLLDKLADMGIPAFTSYGMTEMASQITTGKALGDGSSGKLLPGRELEIRNGEIWVKGDTLFCGYLTTNKQGEAAEQLQLAIDQDGWFCTRDRGYWDNKGNLHITGRSDNMFVCGGENLQPEEVEAVLKRFPGVEDALVFPVADKEFGCLPVAVIKGELPEQHKLDEFVAEQIARFKRPRSCFPWPEQEQPTGLKINRKQVIAEVRAQFNLAE
ncbi:o-succinylbenzoate--CoA ligase [Shewanella submarina]|uniref:O-succinylbenzoate--CoA ligase n=1 Tax=Shewanella submarina TaxID=2016376 RepID=A0ABV7GFB2_9GAMM|nr:o-succinylbenzoate--CoA ligase [Shewanella submarina]MCL1038892.1 o-succinylbenzoate--CoA ligase [Shewanella submarina]